jgi:2-keto-4-pentenoate hydratase/2-oxohepta-3-ene-1,7-dioic acid hydratase in catechol pathway
MGPYLTTLDEVGNLYNLLCYTRQSGWLRDRCHTGAMLIGVERLVSWLSSFVTLQPGDVLHMATMAVDGMVVTPAMTFGPDDFIEGEFERVGRLRVRVAVERGEDWRDPADPGRVQAVPAARDAAAAGRDVLRAPADWAIDETRHLWTTYGNYRTAEEAEGLARSPWPRVLCGPASALGAGGGAVDLPRRATALAAGCELAFVVSRLTRGVSEEEAADHILGYLVMASLLDGSFAATIREPATKQERAMPGVYGRWADGFNVSSPPPVPLPQDRIGGRATSIEITGFGSAEGSTDDYLDLAHRVLAFLSREITVFPGDVVTLGRLGALLEIPADAPLGPEVRMTARIEGIGEVVTNFVDRRSSSRREGTQEG